MESGVLRKAVELPEEVLGLALTPFHTALVFLFRSFFRRHGLSTVWSLEIWETEGDDGLVMLCDLF